VVQGKGGGWWLLSSSAMAPTDLVKGFPDGLPGEEDNEVQETLPRPRGCLKHR
jgi:hypothetical protein